MKLTPKNLQEIVQQIKNKVSNNFITNIILINSSDLLFTFSFSRDEKLFIVLNHALPFISLICENHSLSTVINPLLETLRKEVKTAYILDIHLLNNDKVVVFDLVRNNDFFEKVHFKMILELIPYRPNLLLLDENDIITFAAHYSSFDSSRPILKGLKYDPIKPLDNLDDLPFNQNEFNQYVNTYFIEAISKRKKEKNAKLLAILKAKYKSLNKKIEKLNLEKQDAKNDFIYQDIGQMIYTLAYDQNQLNDYLKTVHFNYDETKDFKYNAELCFKKYKKAKRTIEASEEEIKKANIEKDSLLTSINAFDYLDENEIAELNEKYMKVTGRKNKNAIPSYLPSYIVYKGIKIGFGKNAKQNEYLTFKLAKKDNIYLHFANYPSNHIVIFTSQANNELLSLAADIALILAGQSVGEVYYTEVKNVKKGDKEGQVNLLTHKSITIHHVQKQSYDSLIDIKRFNA